VFFSGGETLQLGKKMFFKNEKKKKDFKGFC